MKVASVSEAKNGLSALLDLVRAGETVIIADRGTPVARLEAVPNTGASGSALARMERAGLVRRGAGDVLDVLASPAPRVDPRHRRAGLEALVGERRAGR